MQHQHTAWLASAADALHAHLESRGEKVEHSSSPWNLALMYFGGGEFALYPCPPSALLGMSVCRRVDSVKPAAASRWMRGLVL